MQSHRSACCWEEFVWTLKNVEESLACRMSSACPFTMMERHAAVSPVPSAFYGLSSGAWASERAACSTRRDGTTLVRSLHIYTVLRRGGYIKKTTTFKQRFVSNHWARQLGPRECHLFIKAQRVGYKLPIRVVNRVLVVRTLSLEQKILSLCGEGWNNKNRIKPQWGVCSEGWGGRTLHFLRDLQPPKHICESWLCEEELQWDMDNSPFLLFHYY